MLKGERERERERERDINPHIRICLFVYLFREEGGGRETLIVCLSYTSDRGSNPKPRYVL